MESILQTLFHETLQESFQNGVLNQDRDSQSKQSLLQKEADHFHEKTQLEQKLRNKNFQVFQKALLKILSLTQ